MQFNPASPPLPPCAAEDEQEPSPGVALAPSSSHRLAIVVMSLRTSSRTIAACSIFGELHPGELLLSFFLVCLLFASPSTRSRHIPFPAPGHTSPWRHASLERPQSSLAPCVHVLAQAVCLRRRHAPQLRAAAPTLLTRRSLASTRRLASASASSPNASVLPQSASVLQSRSAPCSSCSPNSGEPTQSCPASWRLTRPCQEASAQCPAAVVVRLGGQQARAPLRSLVVPGVALLLGQRAVDATPGRRFPPHCTHARCLEKNQSRMQHAKLFRMRHPISNLHARSACGPHPHVYRMQPENTPALRI